MAIAHSKLAKYSYENISKFLPRVRFSLASTKPSITECGAMVA
jgi:hypothetical protein